MRHYLLDNYFNTFNRVVVRGNMLIRRFARSARDVKILLFKTGQAGHGFHTSVLIVLYEFNLLSQGGKFTALT